MCERSGDISEKTLPEVVAATVRRVSGTGEDAISVLALQELGDSAGDVRFSADGRRVELFSRDKKVDSWDAGTGQEMRPPKGYDGDERTIAFHPSGQFTAIPADGNVIQLVDASGGQVVATLRGHTGPVTALAFSPDGGRLISGSDDQTVRIWDIATWQRQVKGEAETESQPAASVPVS